jgi:putative phosphoesterase
VLAVSGNCDTFTFYGGGNAEEEIVISLGGKRIMMTHGDLYSVKHSLTRIVAAASEKGADIVLFGHTHTPHLSYVSGERPYYLFNPGSIKEYPYTYGILTLTENAILFSHGSF